MKVLLVAPASAAFKTAFANAGNLPNGLLSIAAVLEKHGHQVEIFDAFSDSRSVEDFVPSKPDIIGFSVILGPNTDAAISLTKEFKAKIPGAKTVWGNVCPSVLTEQALAEDYIDFVVVGAGEFVMLDLVECLASGSDPSLIKGLAYKIDGKVYINDCRPMMKEMDELPDPAWHLVDMTKYKDLDLNTSRGCAFNCAFCYNRSFNKGQLAYSSVSRILSQMAHLQKTYGARHIRINDDNFTFNRKRLREFCHALIEKRSRLTWSCDSRADLNDADVALMAKSGCIAVTLGLETGSQRMLDFINKGITLKEMEGTFWLLVKHKIRASTYIVHGFPTETIEDFRATDEMLKRLDRPYYLYNRFKPLPGTVLFDYCVKHNLISVPNRLAEWPTFIMEHSNRLNVSQVPDAVMDGAMADYLGSYAMNRFRFTLKHNPAYFWIILTNPPKFWRELYSLVKNQFYVRKSKNHMLGYAKRQVQPAVNLPARRSVPQAVGIVPLIK